jgi:ceramide glucosyltransferase
LAIPNRGAFDVESMLLLIGGALLVHLGVWHWRFLHAIAREEVPTNRLGHYPPISVIRPVRGIDVGAEENFRAALATTYAGVVETLFVFDDDTDPAVPMARRICDDHLASGRAGTAELLFAGTPPPGRTGKLNAMVAGMQRAKGTLIGFGDSDTRPAPELLTQLVDAISASPEIGAAFAPVVVSDPPSTSGDVGYAVMINGLYGPTVARTAGSRGRVPFIMGQLVVFRAEALAAIGGPACADGQLVDDMYIGRCMNLVGYANVMIDRPLPIANTGTSMGQFLRIYRRWMLFGRNGLPLRFTWPLWLRGIDSWLAVALVVVSIASSAGWAAMLASAVLVGQGMSLTRLHERFGGAPIPFRLRWITSVMFLLAPFVLASMKRRTVEWRGRSYALQSRACLAVARETTHAQT